MKNLKKLMAVLLLGAMCLSLAACGGSTTTPAPDEGSNTAAPTDLPADVQAIVDRGVLRVGVKTDVPGFGYQDVLSEEYSGLEIDLAKKIA